MANILEGKFLILSGGTQGYTDIGKSRDSGSQPAEDHSCREA